MQVVWWCRTGHVHFFSFWTLTHVSPFLAGNPVLLKRTSPCQQQAILLANKVGGGGEKAVGGVSSCRGWVTCFKGLMDGVALLSRVQL